MPRLIFNEVGFRGSLSERFERKFIPEPNSGCWLWTGSVDSKGYGQIRMPGKARQGRLRYATHISLELAGHEIPDGLEACHHCDNPCCVNPDHLFVGTHQDNMRDSWRKGRASKPPLAKKGINLKTHCHRGHFLDGDNLFWRNDGNRACRECRRINKRLWRKRTGQ